MDLRNTTSPLGPNMYDLITVRPSGKTTVSTEPATGLGSPQKGSKGLNSLPATGPRIGAAE